MAVLVVVPAVEVAIGDQMVVVVMEEADKEDMGEEEEDTVEEEVDTVEEVVDTVVAEVDTAVVIEEVEDMVMVGTNIFDLMKCSDFYCCPTLVSNICFT